MSTPFPNLRLFLRLHLHPFASSEGVTLCKMKTKMQMQKKTKALE